MNYRGLKGKIAFVTGGTGIIGTAICKRLQKEGAVIVFSFLKSKNKAEKLLSKLTQNEYIHNAIEMDVTKRESVRRAMLFIKEKHGHLDILINNAGINKPNDFDKISDDEWDKIVDVNLKGPFICIQEALSILKKGASIINIGSVSGQYGGPRTAHYAVSKAGLISLGQVAARFLADRDIRVNTIAAGLVASDMANKGTKSPLVQKAIQSILLGRFATPDEIASVVAFLSSEDASYITGQTINVNGGLYF